MSGRLERTFAALRAERRTGLVTYVTAGDPDRERSASILRALDEAGADVLEIGVPFSDPLADGPVIQRAIERALRAGMTLAGTLSLISAVRPHLRAPIVLFTYANPMLRMGVEDFASRAADAGVDGVLVLDLPPEEAGPTHDVLRRVNLDPIFLISPTTTTERIRLASRFGRGFLYVISRLGVTGMREALAAGVPELLARIRQESDLPVALGFGLSRPEHVAEAGRWADAAVVGSALVDTIARHAADPDLPAIAGRYVGWLRGVEAGAESNVR